MNIIFATRRKSSDASRLEGGRLFGCGRKSHLASQATNRLAQIGGVARRLARSVVIGDDKMARSNGVALCLSELSKLGKGARIISRIAGGGMSSAR